MIAGYEYIVAHVNIREHGIQDLDDILHFKLSVVKDLLSTSGLIY